MGSQSDKRPEGDTAQEVCGHKVGHHSSEDHHQRDSHQHHHQVLSELLVPPLHGPLDLLLLLEGLGLFVGHVVDLHLLPHLGGPLPPGHLRVRGVDLPVVGDHLPEARRPGLPAVRPGVHGPAQRADRASKRLRFLPPGVLRLRVDSLFVQNHHRAHRGGLRLPGGRCFLLHRGLVARDEGPFVDSRNEEVGRPLAELGPVLLHVARPELAVELGQEAILGLLTLPLLDLFAEGLGLGAPVGDHLARLHGGLVARDESAVLVAEHEEGLLELPGGGVVVLELLAFVEAHLATEGLLGALPGGLGRGLLRAAELDEGPLFDLGLLDPLLALPGVVFEVVELGRLDDGPIKGVIHGF